MKTEVFEKPRLQHPFWGLKTTKKGGNLLKMM